MKTNEMPRILYQGQIGRLINRIEGSSLLFKLQVNTTISPNRPGRDEAGFN